MQVEIRALLCMAAVFIVGLVWWCEECGAGGFIDKPEHHRPGCTIDELS